MKDRGNKRRSEYDEDDKNVWNFIEDDLERILKQIKCIFSNDNFYDSEIINNCFQGVLFYAFRRKIFVRRRNPVSLKGAITQLQQNCPFPKDSILTPQCSSLGVIPPVIASLIRLTPPKLNQGLAIIAAHRFY